MNDPNVSTGVWLAVSQYQQYPLYNVQSVCMLSTVNIAHCKTLLLIVEQQLVFVNSTDLEAGI